MKTKLATALIFPIAALAFALGGPLERLLIALFFGPVLALAPAYIYLAHRARHSTGGNHDRS